MDRSRFSGFKNLFQDYYPDLVRTALLYIPDLNVAEDCVQDVFTNLWEKNNTLQTVGNPQGYLRHCVRNLCLNYLEHEKITSKYQMEYLKEVDSEESPDDLIRKIQMALEKLPSKRRLILELMIVENKTYQEIATLQGISINTVKDHIKKAYAFLRSEVQQDIRDIILFIAFLK